MGNDTEIEENVTEILDTEANFQHDKENVDPVLPENENCTKRKIKRKLQIINLGSSGAKVSKEIKRNVRKGR